METPEYITNLVTDKNGNKITVADFLMQKPTKENPIFIAYDNRGNNVYEEHLNGDYHIRRYNDQNKMIWHASNGKIIFDAKSNPEVKEISMEEIAEKFGIPVEAVRVKKD